MLYHTLPLTYAGNGWNVNAIPQKRLLQLRFRLGYIAHCHLYSKLPNILAYESRISSLFRPLTLSPNGIAIWCNIQRRYPLSVTSSRGPLSVTTWPLFVTSLSGGERELSIKCCAGSDEMTQNITIQILKNIVIILACDINFYRMKSTKMSEDKRLLYW